MATVAESVDVKEPGGPVRFEAGLALDSVVPNSWNARRLNRDSAAFRELVGSVGAHGVLQPILVRPLGEGFEIVSGERRYWASKAAGLATIPAMVRVLTDVEARELTVVENLHRDDLTALEESEALGVLLDAGWSLERVAETAKRSVRTVARRLSLRNLAGCWREAVSAAGDGPTETDTDGDEETGPLRLSHWGSSHLEIVARLPVVVQERIYVEAVEERLRRHNIESRDVEELREYLEPYTRRLKDAVFDVEDAELLPSAGACSRCPKQTSSQPDLFEADQESTCLDSGCWDGKVAALVERQVALLEADGAKVWLTSTGEYGDESHGKKSAALSGFRKDKRWKDRYQLSPLQKKSGKGLTAVVIATGAKAGQVKYAMSAEAWRKREAKAAKSKRDEAGGADSKPLKAGPWHMFQDAVNDAVGAIAEGERGVPVTETRGVLVLAMTLLGFQWGAELGIEGRERVRWTAWTDEEWSAFSETFAVWSDEDLALGTLRAALISALEYGDRLPEAGLKALGLDVEAMKREAGVEEED